MDILLVEDNPADARLVKEALSEAHVKVNAFWVQDGVEALDFLYRRGEYAARRRPNLILLDLNLPKLGGNEVLQQIKQDPVLRTIPVVILSSSNALRDIQDAYAAHANSFLTKPVDFDEFMALIRLIDAYWLGANKVPEKA
jgi:two-component system, chemotaxis family, response regulator Rcp1